MSKRFTETDKWEDRWFRNLRPAAKLLFMYMCDKCDAGGFYEVDPELIGFHTKIPQDAITPMLSELAAGLERIGCDELGYFVWIRNYLKHQKNLPINPENNAHKPIIAAFEAKADRFPAAIDFYRKSAPKQPLNRGIGKVKVKTVLKQLSKEDRASFDAFRKAYPGRKNGLDIELENLIKRHADYAEVIQLLRPALDVETQWRIDAKTAKLFVPEWKYLQTWINNRCWEQTHSIIHEPAKALFGGDWKDE